MLDILMILFGLYFVLKVYIAVMQIGYINIEKNSKAVILPPSKYVKAANYGIKTQRISIVESIIEYVMFIFWIQFGLVWLDNMISVEISGIQRTIIYVLSFLGIGYIVGLGLDVYKTFKIDKEFGFTTITPKTYILDNIKSLLLTIIIGGLVIGAIGYIIDNFENWWLYSFVVMMVVIILINALYPTIMGLMYNKFEPLKDEELREKIITLLQSVGFKSSGVFQVDASKRDNRLNAYFGGLGSTKRVVLFDTLIEKLTHQELIAVLGHELGHFKNRDLIKNIVMMGSVLFLIFAIIGNIPESFFHQIGLFKNSATLITLFILLSSAISFFLMPIINYVSRTNEFAADQFGKEKGGELFLVNALLKLVEENLSFPKSHPLFVFFYYSHPPLIQRLEKLNHKVS